MKNIRTFNLKIFFFLVVKFSIYLNRRVFVMLSRRNDAYIWAATSENISSDMSAQQKSDQSVNSCILVRIFTRHILASLGCNILFMRTKKDSDADGYILAFRFDNNSQLNSRMTLLFPSVFASV